VQLWQKVLNTILVDVGHRGKEADLSPPVRCFVRRPVASNDAPLIGEPAATRGRSATEVAMRTPVRGERYPFEIQLYGGWRSRTARIDSMSISRLYADALVASTARRWSTNAPQRTGESQWNAAMSTPV
jgi:hypothetical protein